MFGLTLSPGDVRVRRGDPEDDAGGVERIVLTSERGPCGGEVSDDTRELVRARGVFGVRGDFGVRVRALRLDRVGIFVWARVLNRSTKKYSHVLMSS